MINFIGGRGGLYTVEQWRFVSSQFSLFTDITELVSLWFVFPDQTLVKLATVSILSLSLSSTAFLIFIFPEIFFPSLCLSVCQIVMESAIAMLVSQFKKYAGSDGSSDTLSKDEFCRLVASELPNFVKVRINHLNWITFFFLSVKSMKTPKPTILWSYWLVFACVAKAQ